MDIRKTRIGFFVVGGLALFGVGLFLIGDRHQLFARRVEYYSDFVDLAGMATGAKVRVAGMDAGQVLAIAVPASPSAGFRVKWRIDAKFQGLVRTDSVATIGTEGVVGGTYLSVRAGSAQGVQAAPLATIRSQEPIELSAVVADGAGLLHNAQDTLKEIGAKLGVALDGMTLTAANVNDVVVGLKEGRGTAGMLLRDDALAREIRQAVTTTTSNVRDVVADLKEGRGVAGALLRDEALAGQVRGAVTHVQEATADIGHASRQADALISDLNSRQISRQIGEAVDYLDDSARQIHHVVSEIAEPDQQKMSAGANIRESLMHANRATANLADATEALKHNFLTRGFFEHRGYYSLADISPEKYRRDGAFTDGANRRVWLKGSELFQSGSNGEEELSARGKAILNDVLTAHGDSIVDHPVVIEGYWNGDLAADRLRRSRSRAIVVRQHVLATFQLDMNNVGVVPMKNAPPNGLGHPTWDGICLVVLTKN
jgi:phospholipid/cholesterol/gamma-HCH transport system substrate-binding protein